MQDKIKVLWLSDFLCATGFSQVAHNLVRRLLATGKYDITIIGINHHGEPYDFTQWPLKVYPARHLAKIADERYQDLFGRQRVLDELGTGEYDIFFSLQDTFVMEEIGAEIIQCRKELIKRGKKPFRWIFYFPVDSQLKENWVTDSIAKADFPVAYTQWGKAQTLRYTPDLAIDVIYHGVDLDVFKPLPDTEVTQFKQAFFSGLAQGKFIVTNVNRNQRRKDIPRTIAAFAEFHKHRPNTLLYLHMKPHDNGGSILEMARHFQLQPQKDFVYPKKFNEHTGFPLDIVNGIYNASDVVMSTTLGEGWGLSSIEAMATKTPIIFPNNTALTEIGADGRATLVPSGATLDDWVCLGPEDMNQFRPVTSITGMVQALLHHHDHPEQAAQQAETAFAWVQQLSWDRLAKQWETVFSRAVWPEFDWKTVERNSPCPVCGVKWKKCERHNPDVVTLKGGHALS